MKKRIIKYGGMVCGDAEVRAVMSSVKDSVKNGNWQQAEQGKLLEKECAKFLGVKNAILTNSGSSAFLLALSALELPRGSEVIISAVTFPTVFNGILQCGLVPVVVDAKVGSYVFSTLDVEKAITKKTKAIVAIHALGYPCNMPKIMALAKPLGIKVVEDGCDTFGGKINGKMIGSFGDISITSFHAAHIVSMGVGGGVFTNDAKLAQNIRMYRDWGRQANTDRPHTCKTLPKDYNPRFVYDKIGYNFQILELQAAMGRVQLKKAVKIKEMRKKNVQWLYKHLQQFPNLILPIMPTWAKSVDICWFAFPITYTGDRGKLVAHLESNGIETRSMFAGNIIRHPAYKNSKYRIGSKLDEADYILKHSFWISCHPRLTEDDRNYIMEVFDSFFKQNA